MSANSVAAFSANIQQIIHMTKEEKNILATRLQAELAEFRQREQIYTEKRQELQDLEKQYRKKQDQMVGNQGKYKQQIKTNDMIIQQLLEQIDQNRRINEDRDNENEDIQEKISTQRQAITKREDEITELRDKISVKASKAEELRSVLDKLAMHQKILIEEKEQDEEEIENLTEIRQMRQNEADEYNNKLRKVKNEQFRGQEKLQQIINVRETKFNQLEFLEQELHRVQNKLSQSKEQLDTAQEEKYELENKIHCQSQELSNLNSQKRLLEEHNRRLSTGISDLKRKLADAESMINKLDPEYNNIRNNNKIRSDENTQLQQDLENLDEHLNILETQNKELEKELESFALGDDAIKSRLRSTSPVQMRAQVTPQDAGKGFQKSGFDPYNRYNQSGASTNLGATAFKESCFSPYDKNKNSIRVTAEKDHNKSLFSSIGLESTNKKHFPLRNTNAANTDYAEKQKSGFDEKENSQKDAYHNYIALRDRSRSRSPSLESHISMRNSQGFRQDKSPNHYSNQNATRNNQASVNQQYGGNGNPQYSQTSQNYQRQEYNQQSQMSQKSQYSVNTLQPRIRGVPDTDQKLSRITENHEEFTDSPDKRQRRWSPLRGLLRQRLQQQE